MIEKLTTLFADKIKTANAVKNALTDDIQDTVMFRCFFVCNKKYLTLHQHIL